MHLSTSLGLAFLGLLLPTAFGTSVTWDTGRSLPTPRSDMTATLATAGSGTSRVIILGGCAADQVTAPLDDSSYYCPEVTDRCDSYDPVLNTYSPGVTGGCAPMLSERYRHAAVNVGGMVWVIGGSNPDENVNKNVEVYDPVTDTWTDKGVWPGATSDLAAFSVGTDLYVVGGYNVTDFSARAEVFKIDTTSHPLTFVPVASMKEGRGDVFAAVTDDHVYVTGGYTHVNNFEAPHSSVERYDLATGLWDNVADTNYARGDKALVHMNGLLYAIGGENKDAEGATNPVEHVEVYDIAGDVWVDETTIPSERFRFVAVGHEGTDSIYIFGGQKYLDLDCTSDGVVAGKGCYPVSDDVLKFTDSDWVIEAVGGNTAGAVGSGAAVLTIASSIACTLLAAL